MRSRRRVSRRMAAVSTDRRRSAYAHCSASRGLPPTAWLPRKRIDKHDIDHDPGYRAQIGGVSGRRVHARHVARATQRCVQLTTDCGREPAIRWPHDAATFRVRCAMDVPYTHAR